MPIAKGKGGSASHRYRPASEYDDATLAQKREYWRNKKREQRARLSERRGKPALHSRGEKLPHLNAPAAVHSSLSSSLAALSSPVQTNDESCRPASESANRVGDCSHEATENQKEKWFQTVSLNKVLPPLPVSCSISGKAAGGNTATANRPTVKAAVRAVTSTTSSGTQLNTSSSVPLIRVTRITNGSSAKIAPQPCVSMQGPSVPRTQHKAQAALPIQPKRSATNVTTGMILVSSPCVPVSIKTERKTTNTTPHSGTKSALVALQRTKGAGNTQPSLESEEERAAKRREHWRIKKREQRAKLAARVAKARERAHGVEMTFQRLTAQKTGTAVSTGLLPPQSFLKGAGQKQVSRVKTSFVSAKREKLQSGPATVAITNLQADQIKVENTDVNKMTQAAITSDFTSAKTALASQRKLPSYGHLSNVTRGIARCKTPRQRFIEAQKSFMSQRSLRCKSPLVASMFGSRSMPKVDPNDTPEQIIAKRREYWRIKKREQRAKLSMEVKARLKEKDSLMRRVKRYQKILEDMRKARAMTHLTGSTLTHASETIGGFIKEDGTLTVNILQSPTDHNTAEDKSDEDLHVALKNTPQHQPDTKQRSVAPVRINQPNPPLRPPQVKVSVPLAGQSVNKSPRLLSIRPRTQLESTTVVNSDKFTPQTVGQLKLTHPQTPQNATSGGSTTGSNLGGCVMKMAVSTSVPSLSALSADPELGEEEKMAKKREYWRIKKREQRAARAVRLKQGAFQAKASPVLQRKKAQKQVAVTSMPLNRSVTNYTGNVQPLTNNIEPVMPLANEIKKESESMPAVDLNSQPEQAICPDIKPPASPPPRPAPQPEPDPALSADSQAATLLAVASMKKLLEESLSTVTDCNREQTDIKMETTEDASELDMKPNLPQIFFQKDDIAPIAANLTLQIKSWQPDSDELGQADSPSPQLKSSSEIIETPPPLSASTEVVLPPTCEHSSQTALNFIVNPSVEASSDGPSSPRRTQRRTKKVAHQNCCSPEPPKLHHATATSVDQLQPQRQHCEQQIQAQEQCQNNSSPSIQRYRNVVTEQCGLTSLQKKREYWKLMKRQQRARLRARQKERHGECSSRLSQRNIQAPGLVVFNAAKAKPALWPKPSTTSVAAVNSIPTVLVVSQTTSNADQTPDTLQVKLPVTSRAQNNVNTGLSQIISDCAGAPESPRLSQEWTPRDTDVDSTPSLPTLKPPDNPLSSINLQPIEPLGHSPNPKVRRPINFPNAQVQSPTHVLLSPTKLTPTSTLVPPKQMPGESDEDFLRRKREYWRIKKKEQRARKAIRDKGIAARKASNSWTPILPARQLQTQDSGQWVNSCEESELQMSTSVDTDTASFTYPDYSAPVEDESELLFADYEINNGEEGPVSDTLWRNRYLMDYDPLNQLLVCMVCGELQYSHSLEGVRAHIDEAHPHTLSLEPEEKQGILDAWDEQVSQRERFFTSQLQQHGGALAEAHRD